MDTRTVGPAPTEPAPPRGEGTALAVFVTLVVLGVAAVAHALLTL